MQKQMGKDGQDKKKKKQKKTQKQKRVSSGGERWLVF